MKGVQRVAVLVLAVIASAALTVAVETEELSLERAIRTALEESPELREARTEVDVTEAGVGAARSEMLPTLSASGSYGRFSGDVFFSRFIPGSPAPDQGTDIGPYDGNQVVAVELSQVLYAGGGLTAGRQRSVVEHRIARETLRGRRLDLVSQVVATYYGVLLAEKRVEVASRSIARSEEALEVVRRRHAEQEALEVELLGAQAQLAADRLAELEARNAHELTRRRLNLLLGRDLEAELSLTGSLDDRIDLLSQGEGIERAVDGSPLVMRARLQAELADAMAAGARSVRKPKLKLQAVYSRIDNDLFFNGSYAGAVLNLSIPFLQEARAGSAASRQARALQQLAEHAGRDAEAAIKLESLKTYRSVDEGLHAVQAATANLAYLEERYRVTTSAYREQLVTFDQLLDSHSDLSEAELTLHAAHYKARLAEAEVQRLTGDVPLE